MGFRVEAADAGGNAAGRARPGAGETPVAESFASRLDARMRRLAAAAIRVETLRDGARLFLLAHGREVEQARGRTPYVVAPGSPPLPGRLPPANG